MLGHAERFAHVRILAVVLSQMARASYRLESDPRVPKENVAALEERFREPSFHAEFGT